MNLQIDLVQTECSMMIFLEIGRQNKNLLAGNLSFTNWWLADFEMEEHIPTERYPKIAILRSL